jgi:Tfp pilus assembly protein PilW
VTPLDRLKNRLKCERGTTLVELLVATTAGIVVMATLSLLIIVVLHGSARVSARVDATQRGRIAVTRIVEQLHSACLAPKVAPVLKESSGTALKFIHSVGSQGSAVAPVPTRTKIEYSSGTLYQYDEAGTGAYPNTTYATATKTTLATTVAPIPPSSAIFTYFGSTSGGPVGEVVPGVGGLTEIQAAGVIEVRVGLSASPTSTPVKDSAAAASIKDGVVLRLTAPSYNEKATAPPCQ